jgi:CelD/BcsL family acetyltransferase involved in cellulose biosynthesis
MRTKVRSTERAAEKAGARFAWCNEAGEIEPFLTALFDLHQRRWTRAGKPGSFADERRRCFYAELAPVLLARGELRLARMEQDGRAVAVQLGAQCSGTYYQIQEGYDPDLAERRVGTALRAWSLRELIESGAHRCDFMAGVSRHKTDWGARPIECVTLAFPLPRVRARLAYALRAGADRLLRRS